MVILLLCIFVRIVMYILLILKNNNVIITTINEDPTLSYDTMINYINTDNDLKLFINIITNNNIINTYNDTIDNMIFFITKYKQNMSNAELIKLKNDTNKLHNFLTIL